MNINPKNMYGGTIDYNGNDDPVGIDMGSMGEDIEAHYV
jgi:hypothetical protein